MGTCMMLSSLSTTSMEDVAEASGHGLRWMQLYVYRDREITKRIVQRAQKAGYKAIVVTVDTPVIGKRLVDSRDHFNLPSHLHLANFSSTTAASSLSGGGGEAEGSFLRKYRTELLDASLTWEGIDWIKSLTNLPVLVNSGGWGRGSETWGSGDHSLQPWRKTAGRSPCHRQFVIFWIVIM